MKKANEREWKSGHCNLDYLKKNLKADKPSFTVKTYHDYIDNKKKEIVSKHDIELAEYFFDHFQYFTSLSLKE